MTTTDVTTDVTVEVLTGTDDLLGLREEWEALYEACPTATPFQTWGWLASWWEAFGTAGALRVLTARSGNALTGVLPLMVARPGVWQFVGTGLSDHLDALVRPDHLAGAVPAWIDRLHREDVRLLDLHAVRPTAAVWRLRDAWPGPSGAHRSLECPELDAGTWEELLHRWSKNTKKTARQTLNRLERAGYRQTRVPADAIGPAAEDLVALHREVWRDRGITPEHTDPRFSTFVRRACERMVSQEAVTLFRLDPPEGERDPARHANLLLIGHDYVGGWLGGADDSVRRRLSIALLEIHQAAAIAQDHGVPVITMLRGTEPGKLRAAQRTPANHRLLLGGQGAAALTTWAARSVVPAATARLKRWERDSDTGRRVVETLRRVRDRAR